jgi:hypothetical protein
VGDAAKEVEALIRGYIDHWNAKDVEAVWSRFYRLDESARLKSATDVQRIFDDLVAQGFDHSEILSVTVEMHGPDRATARLRFTRWTTDGAVMPPKDRGAEYGVRRFPDGWRITSVLTTD